MCSESAGRPAPLPATWLGYAMVILVNVGVSEPDSLIEVIL